VLGAVAGLPVAALRAWAQGTGLVAAVLAVALLAALTRGLHLDGLADTVDGLASRAPAEQALTIMRRSDIGPFGVLALVFAVLLSVADLATVDGGTWRPLAALTVAAATGRLLALAGAHVRVPSARASGFGSFVASSVPGAVLAVESTLVLGLGAALAAATSADVLGWLASQLAALVAGGLFLAHAVRRLGGVSGDVFGALVELGTVVTLTGLTLSGPMLA
jgi:adenosylcobinamide-GDP ribazoletransferase